MFDFTLCPKALCYLRFIGTVPQVIRLIIENYAYNEITAANNFYSSNLYALLEQEDTKLWHLTCILRHVSPLPFNKLKAAGFLLTAL